MARALSSTLDGIQISTVRRPKYKVEVFDVRGTEADTTPTTISDVVLGNPLPTSVGPRDFTGDTISVQMEERTGDYIAGGIAASDITITIVDGDGALDPVSGSNGRWLRQRNVVRITEGDAAVPEADWPVTFTGVLTGQPGLSSGRVTGARTLTAKAVSREAGFLKLSKTSVKFAEGTSYSTMVETEAQTGLGLDAAETSLPAFGTNLTKQAVTQFVEQSPLVAIAQLGFPDGLLPRFDGQGKLILSDSNITKGAARSYANTDGVVRNIERPFIELNGFNEVIVRGLEPVLTPVVGDQQVLATANMTLGFFTTSKKIPIRFSDDNRLQGDNTTLKTISSINDGIIPLGSETWVPDIDGVSTYAIGGTIDIRSPYKPAITTLTIVTQVVAAVIPDIAPPLGGPTISVGKVAWSLVLMVILTILQTVNTGQYEILGEPVEFVFQELKATARIKGVAPVDRRTLDLENHLLDSQGACDTAAVRILNLAQARQNIRQVEMVHDLLLEPDDIFTHDGRSYMIQSISRTLTREGDPLAKLSCFEVTPGVFP